MVQPDAGPAAPTFDADVAVNRAVWTASKAGYTGASFDLAVCEYAEGDGIEFHLPRGDLLRLLRANGFEVLDLIEIQAPPGAEDHPFYSSVPAARAKRWSSEETWVARKLAPDAARG